METITVKNFDKECLLLTESGYRIKGACDQGIELSNPGVEAIPMIYTVCKKKGCTPSVADDNKSTIIAKIE